MKLQTKINYRFLLLLLVLFFVAGVSLYVVLSSLINHRLDETLENRMVRIEQSLKKDPSVALIMNSPDQDISIRPTTKQQIPAVFGDTVLMDKNEHEAIEYRKLTFGATSGLAFYEVSIVLSKMESEDLKELILTFMALLFGIIAFVLFFLNRWLTASIWSPFYRTIEKLKTYTIGKKNSMYFHSSNVFEFNQLNKSLSEMVEKAESDFNNLEGGQINLISHPDKLVISNTGKPLTMEPEKLFQRFSKHHAGNDSTGLGLAIASQICIISDVTLHYKYLDGLHQLSICQKS